MFNPDTASPADAAAFDAYLEARYEAEDEGRLAEFLAAQDEDDR